jgi:hypothetical protein
LDANVKSGDIDSEEAYSMFWSLKDHVVSLYSADSQVEELGKIWSTSAEEYNRLFTGAQLLAGALDHKIGAEIEGSRKAFVDTIAKRDNIVDILIADAGTAGFDAASRESSIKHAVRQQYRDAKEYLEFSSRLYESFQVLGHALGRVGVVGGKACTVSFDALLEASTEMYLKNVLAPTAREIYAIDVEACDA